MREGFTQNQILCTTTLPSIIILSLFMIRRYGSPERAFYTQYKRLHIVRGLALIGITFFSFKAISNLPLADFYGVAFSSPFLVTLGAFLIFRERVHWSEWAAILIGFSGVIVVAQPDYNSFNFGYLYAFGAALCVAAAGLLVRRIGRAENPYLFVIFGSGAIFIANIIPAVQGTLPEAINLKHILVFMLYAITVPHAILIMSATFARAHSISLVAPFQYLQIVWGSVLGYFVFHDIPQHNTVIGSVIVISCGLYILLHHKRKARKDLLP